MPSLLFVSNSEIFLIKITCLNLIITGGCNFFFLQISSFLYSKDMFWVQDTIGILGSNKLQCSNQCSSKCWSLWVCLQRCLAVYYNSLFIAKLLLDQNMSKKKWNYIWKKKCLLELLDSTLGALVPVWLAISDMLP